MRTRKGNGAPLALWTALMVCLVAALAGFSLWTLFRMHHRQAHSTATRTVLSVGQLIVDHLIEQPEIRGADLEGADWQRFSERVRALHTLENGLQYVSVSRDGVTVFHEQARALDVPDIENGIEDGSPRVERGQLQLNRRLLSVGTGVVPVVTFSAALNVGDDSERAVEIGLRRDTVEREELMPAVVSASIFRMALLTVGVAFALCVLVVVWMMRREMARERVRREEEHLAFAGVMAGGIVHDFRNPMSSLRLDVQMLRREVARGDACQPDRLAVLTDRAARTIRRMETSFQEFLYLSNPQSGRPERVDLAACLRDCLEMVAPRLEQRAVHVEMQCPSTAVVVLAHPAAIRRAIVNVLTNAEQFSEDGGTIEVQVRAEGSQALLDVIDQGPGVPVSERKRVFDLFVSSRPGGTGLGLFLARTALERCGGSISLEDGGRGGACFRIRIPLAPVLRSKQESA